MWLPFKSQVSCSEYLLSRLIPLLTFSNPFKIPERTRLKRSIGLTNFIKCKRTSTFNDEKFIVDVWIWSVSLKVCCTNEPSTKLLTSGFFRTENWQLKMSLEPTIQFVDRFRASTDSQTCLWQTCLWQKVARVRDIIAPPSIARLNTTRNRWTISGQPSQRLGKNADLGDLDE